MATTTTTTANRRPKRIPREPTQLKEDMKQLSMDIANLISLTAAVGREQGTRSKGTLEVNIPGPNKTTRQAVIGSKEIASFRRQINDVINEIYADYSTLFRSKSRGGAGTGASSRKGRPPNLSLIAPSFADFWARANMGPVNPDLAEDPETNPPLISRLPLLRRGITTPALLQSAWATYADVNGLKNGPEFAALMEAQGYEPDPRYADRNYLHADQHMIDTLGLALDWLEGDTNGIPNTPTQKQKQNYAAKQNPSTGARSTRKPKPLERFNRFAFQRFYTTMLGALYIVPRPGNEPTPAQIAVHNDRPMSEEQEEELRRDENRTAVQQEINLLKTVRGQWNRILGTGPFAPKKGRRSQQGQRAAEEGSEASDVDEGSAEEQFQEATEDLGLDVGQEGGEGFEESSAEEPPIPREEEEEDV